MMGEHAPCGRAASRGWPLPPPLRIALVITLAIALVIAGGPALLSSGLPDGLERALADLGVRPRAAAFVWRGLAGAPAQAVAGVAGTLVACGVAWAVGRALARKGGRRP
jgi:hypothetical protein